MEIYKTLDYIYYLIFSIYNFFVRLSIPVRPKLKKMLSHNIELKRSKDYCFVIGNGPSLKNINLAELNEEDTFAVNYFYNHCPENFKSKFFVAIDQNFYKTEEKQYILQLYNEKKDMQFILKSSAYTLLDNWDLGRTFFIHPKLFQYGDVVACDCAKPMTACINVVLQCIQIALSMGYKKIYLLGCDFTQYADIKSHHFYDTKDDDDRRAHTNMGDDARWAYLAHYHHYALRKYAEKTGCSIINLTKGSLIDAYECLEYRDVIVEKKASAKCEK